MFSPEFYRKLVGIGERTNTRPEDMLAIMLSESTLDPRARNPHAPAAGLFQLYFEGPNASAEADAFAALPAEKQLDAYEAFLRPYTNVAKIGPETLYQINFVPLSLKRGTGSDTVIAERGGTGYSGQEASFYKANTTLDADGDGRITPADLAAVLEKKKRTYAAKWQTAMSELAASGYSPAPPSPIHTLPNLAQSIPWLALGMSAVILGGTYMLLRKPPAWLPKLAIS